ncbi:ATP-binding protein [Bacillus canaveralius]|uniref:ATP-binding protein n=1 Tax=Bacillus canaveralius TaxID=1403243 RepID=UPI000F79B07E|nr:ATP-binding protein [Bacillus canaveralius]RSK49679.1 ATP-binding protein [Bacillus canaveralius]
MYDGDVKIGKIIKIEGLTIHIEIIEKDVANKLVLKYGINDYVVSINKMIYSVLPNGKKIIARITKIFDKNTLNQEDIFIQQQDSFVLEATFIGIYDEFLQNFDSGINTFPIIGSEIFSINQMMYKSVVQVNSPYRLQIGVSYEDNQLDISANPDILFGKHMGVFGNTGTGKSCTVTSVIQGLKKRLIDKEGKIVQAKPKIVIFDSNDEYEQAFEGTEFSVKKIKKEDLYLPHYHLSLTEYYRFLGASLGVQAPILKNVIKNLKETSDETEKRKFLFGELHQGINKWLWNNAKKKDKDGKETGEFDNYKASQWFNWCSTMSNRIHTITDDPRIFPMIEWKDGIKNTIEEIMDSDDEIILIDADFEKDELDIMMFLFSKLVYEWAVNNRKQENISSLVILFEEAHRYINEQEQDEFRLGTYYIERLAREGRKYGISLIISSQRPSELTKSIISQCNSFIVHRITNKLDLEFINRNLTSNHQELIKFIPGLEKQYAIVFGEAFGYTDIVKIASASPVPKSEDPKVIGSWLTD